MSLALDMKSVSCCFGLKVLSQDDDYKDEKN